MNVSFAKSSVWQLLSHSDTLTALILLSLFFMSIFCWATLLYKWILGRIKKRQLTLVIEQLKSVKTVEDIVQVTAKNSSTLGGYFLARALSYLKDILVSAEKSNTPLSTQDWSLLEQSLYQLQDEIYNQEDHLNPVISMCATLSPLIGLFGTVWGLMNSFVGISHQQSADITAVAPGIAQALIATVGGIFVAIPAYAMYTYLQLQLRSIDRQVGAIAERFLWVAQPLFAHKQRDEK